MKRSEWGRLVGPLMNRLQMMVARVVLTRVDDGLGVQAVQASGLADELIEGERFQNYGFTSVPLPGAEAVAVFCGGLRSHGLIIAVEDRRYRLKSLKPGESAIYDDQGQCVVLTRDGIRIVTAKSVEFEVGEHFRVTAPDIELIGNVVVGGEAGQGKAIARHDDPVVAGKVVAGATKARAL